MKSSATDCQSRPPNRKWEMAVNVVAAFVFASFVHVFSKSLLHTFRLSLLLILVKELLDAGFYLCRKMPSVVSFRPVSWIIAFGGTFTPYLLRPTDASVDSMVGDAVLYAGFLCQIIVVSNLNRSLGIVPAIREIKKKGFYRIVRHPLYLSYFIQILGFVICNLSLYNICIFLLHIALQINRTYQEEELLLKNEDYAEYAKQTKWRIIPFIY